MNQDSYRCDGSTQTALENAHLFKSYVGVKILLARPMHENEWAKNKNQETGGRDGYLVIYDNGYQSWSPKDVFETHYRELSVTEKQVAQFRA